MGLQIDKIRSAMVEAGYAVQSITPGRGPDGKVKLVVSVLKQAQPDQMIVQPAPDLAMVYDFEQIPGIGAVTADKLRAGGIRTLTHYRQASRTDLVGRFGVRVVDLIDKYLQQQGW